MEQRFHMRSIVVQMNLKLKINRDGGTEIFEGPENKGGE